MIAVRSSPLSAIGSRMAPSLLRCFHRRATHPSIPSLAAANRNVMIAAQRCHSSGEPVSIPRP